MALWKEALVAIIGNTILLVWLNDFAILWALSLSTIVTVSVVVLWMLYKFIRAPKE